MKWAVYKNKTNSFMARLFKDGEPQDQAIISREYEEVINCLKIMNLHRVSKTEQDEPYIMETWQNYANC